MAREEGNTLQSKRLRYAVLLALAIAAPFILTGPYLIGLLVLSCIFAILALSLNIIMGYMGQFSFGHQAIWGIGGYTTAFLVVRLGLSPWLGIAAGVIIAAIVGFVIGYTALRATRGVYLAIITYGVGVIIFLTAVNEYEFTGGITGIPNIPPLAIALPVLPELVFNTELSFYYLALVCLIFTVYLISRWLRSRFGKAVIAIRENEELAKSVGIYSYKYYVMAFALASALAGLSGGLYVEFMGGVNPSLMNVYYIFILLVMVLVGGTGTIGGPILGAFFYIFVLELIPVPKGDALVIFGAIVLIVVIFMPRGVYPYLSEFGSRLISRLTARGKQPEGQADEEL